MPNVYFFTIGMSFASGILVRSFFDIGGVMVVWFLLLGIACAAAWRAKANGFHTPLFLTSLALCFFALGVFRFDSAEQSPNLLSQLVNTDVVLEGVIMREPDERERLVHLYVREQITEEIVLVTTDRFQNFAYGDRVRFAGTLTVPESFETDLGRTFNYPGYLKARGVSHSVTFASTTVIEQGVGNPILATLLEGKHAFMVALERVLHEPYGGLGEGVLLGVKRALGDELEQVFRDVGIIHIVVLSGYNVMIVVEAVSRVLTLFFMPRLRLILGLVAITVFALLVGLSATVVRASIMAALLLIARATGRVSDTLRMLMLAGVVMLLLNPYLLAFDPGFQLSFLATLGLILLSPALNERFTFVPSWFGAREFFVATLATQIFVLPLLLYQMGLLSLVAIVANVLILPMVPVAMLTTFLTGLVGLFSQSLALIVGVGAYLSLGYIIELAQFFARVPYASVSVPSFPFWVVLMAYAVLVVFVYWLMNRNAAPENNTIDRTITDDFDTYADWTIEEEKEKPLGSGLPFR